MHATSQQKRSAPALGVEHLSVAFPDAGGRLHAVNDVSFEVFESEILGIVGESGSGKSVTCLALAGLIGASAEVAGEVRFGESIFAAKTLRTLSRRRLPPIGVVFQEPVACLNPVRTIGDQITEAAVAAGSSRRGAIEEAVGLLDAVAIPNPKARMHAYPSELSGGMSQRVMIAMALAMRPHLIIADEPTTALDVTVQAQVVALLVKLVRERAIPMIFISHDLDLIAGVCDRIAVMYAGSLAEVNRTDLVYDRPLHPYTRLLIEAMPGRGEPRTRLADIPGELHLHHAAPRACSFAPRCPRVLPRCRSELPVAMANGASALACFNPWN